MVDDTRRRFLTATVAVIGGGGLIGASIPFILSMTPSDAVTAAGAPVDVDVSKLEPGSILTVPWRGRPVWVLRRTPEQLKVLQDPDLQAKLRDPDSLEPQQFGNAVANWNRSLVPEYMVLVAICTHLGCVPGYRPDLAPADLGSAWPGGIYCPCHGSRYDLSGRVYKLMPAPLNLPVPPYYFITETLLSIGELSDESEQNWKPKVW